MHLFQFAEPVPGQEPADALRTLVFMANFAAQDITGSMDASRGVGELIDDLGRPSPFQRTLIFGVTKEQVTGELSQEGFPLVASTGEDQEPPALGWLVMSLPLVDNTHVAEVSLVLDVDLVPLENTLTAETEDTVAFLLRSAIAVAQKIGRSHVHLWQQHPLDASTIFEGLFSAAGFEYAHSETEFVLEPQESEPSDITVFANENYPVSYLSGVSALYEQASAEQPRGSLKLGKQAWDPERLAASTAHFRSLGTENYSAIAVDSSGTPIALSEVWILPGGSPEVAIQGVTYVDLKHRGQGLGRAVKQGALTAALRAHPTLQRVYTSVAPENRAIIGLNQALGATPVAQVSAFQHSS